MVRLVPIENDVIPMVLDYFPTWPGWVQGTSDGPLVPMVRLVPMEKHPIPMVLLVNMHPLREVKMLLPIEIDESFFKVVPNWQSLTAVSFMVFIVRNSVLILFIGFPVLEKRMWITEKLWLIDTSLDMFCDWIYNIEATRTSVGLHLHCGSLVNIT